MATGTTNQAPLASTDIKNARVGRERLDALIATLKAQREQTRATFLRNIAADLAGLKYAPSKIFTDAQFAKYTAAQNADKDIENRIAAFESLVPLLDDYIEQLAEKNRSEVVAQLAEERAGLEAQREKEDADKALVESRIEAIDAEVAKWSTPARKKTRAKSAANKK